MYANEHRMRKINKLQLVDLRIKALASRECNLCSKVLKALLINKCKGKQLRHARLLVEQRTQTQLVAKYFRRMINRIRSRCSGGDGSQAAGAKGKARVVRGGSQQKQDLKNSRMAAEKEVRPIKVIPTRLGVFNSSREAIRIYKLQRIFSALRRYYEALKYFQFKRQMNWKNAVF